ncbi:MAG: transcriptional regulator [Elusimicrobia bacterium]|nr:transcriptional regulator [Elusimicrobiota bacterium]
MKKMLSLSAIGKDRTGIVSSISEILFKLGCNIEDSTMTLLSGQFAVILLLDCPKNSDVSKIKRSLNASMKKLGLSYSITEVDKPKTNKKNFGDYIIAVYGSDRVGIVYNVSKYLADKKINITDVQTKISGKKDKVYIMLLEVNIPKTLKIDNVKQNLKQLAKELNVEIFVNQADSQKI